MPSPKTNPAFLNGVPEMLALRLLADRSMHGYDIVQAIKAATGAELEFGEGCIYPILHRLEARGMLVARAERVGSRKRIVYRVTRKGLAQLSETTGVWQRTVDAVQRALKGGLNEEPTVERGG